MSASALTQFGTKHIAKGIGRLATEVIESGSGSYVTMVGGRKSMLQLLFNSSPMTASSGTIEYGDAICIALD